MANKLITFIVALVLITTCNVITLYSLENISSITNSTSDFIRNFYYCFSMGMQILALGLGAFYFFTNADNDKNKVLTSKKNELLNYLVNELKGIRETLERFFDQDFIDDRELRKYKELIVETFSIITIYIESNENIFKFSTEDLENLLEPSSKIQNNHLFTINKVSDFKVHDTSLLKSEMLSAFTNAYKSCWKGII